MQKNNANIQKASNPFTPSFGKTPPILAGRNTLLNSFEHAFSESPNDPNLCSLFAGPRGVGKTVLLSHLANMAQSNAWVSANVTARPGMLEDIIERTKEAAVEFIEKPASARLSSVSVLGGLGASWEFAGKGSKNWRSRMNQILDSLQKHEVGLVITIDEVDPTLDELIDFAATFQHFVREDRKVALLMAGLPINISALLSNKSVSFLRRCTQHQIGRIKDDDVMCALRQTFNESGKQISDDSLDYATERIGGFAYMMQLVGFRMWDVANNSNNVSIEHAKLGCKLAQKGFVDGVVKKTLQELSDGDIAFLEAMLTDTGGQSKLSDIAQRLGKSTNYARVYKTRLVTQGVISAPRRGMVAFELPLLRECLQN